MINIHKAVNINFTEIGFTKIKKKNHIYNGETLYIFAKMVPNRAFLVNQFYSMGPCAMLILEIKCKNTVIFIGLPLVNLFVGPNSVL